MNPRVLLWVGLLFLAYLNFDAWMKDYRPASRDVAPAPTSAPAAGTPSPAGRPVGRAAHDCGRCAARRHAATAAPDTIAGALAGAGTIRVVTDVLDMDISLAGGELVRADIRQYPQHKDDPKKTPVRLFNVDSPATQFLFQSGLTTGEAGRAEPNHKATFTAAAAEFRLAEGSDTLEVPMTWTDGAGVTVTKRFVLRRGSYQVGHRLPRRERGH